MKRFLMTSVLTVALANSVMAGDMHGDNSPAPPAPSPTPLGIRSAWAPPMTSTPGDVHTGDSTQPMFDEALSAVLSVFRLVF